MLWLEPRLYASRSGERFGLPFTKATDRRQRYLGAEPLSAMKMIEECAPNEPVLKSAYQLLSGVEHGLWHGYARLLQRSESETPGTAGLGLAVGAKTLARDLAASMRMRARWKARLVHRLELRCCVYI
jgi:hypothetical protein